MTWEICLGIVTLVTFGIAVVTPIVKLNNNITHLSATIRSLNENMHKSDERLTKHGIRLDDHEHRITKLETIHEQEGKKL